MALGLDLRNLQHVLPPDDPSRAALGRAVEQLRDAVQHLRQIAHGARPGALDDGLAAALRSLVQASPEPVEMDLDEVELPEPVVTAAYYVAAEAFANALKHSGGGRIAITLREADGLVTLSVVDDGKGGVATTGASGLTGIADRVATVGGSLHVHRPPRRGHKGRGGAAMRVVIGEDSALMREGIARLLHDAGRQVVPKVGDAPSMLTAVGEHEPGVVIIDVRMPPDMTDVDALRRVGAGGTALDRPSRRHNPIETLTPREKDVLSLMAEGRSNAAIARSLVLNERTVESHIRSILTKLDLADSRDDHRRVLAVLTYLRAGMGPGQRPH